MEFLEKHRHNRPAILCGDLNAEPSEPVYSTLTQSNTLSLASAYATVNEGQEPPYSTWKIRGDGEAKNNLDYILYTDEGSSALHVSIVLSGNIYHSKTTCFVNLALCKTTIIVKS